MSSQLQRIAVSCICLLLGSAANSQEPSRKSIPWDTCFFVEGKSDGCAAGRSPRPFKNFLTAAQLLEQFHDGFAGELRWELEQTGPPMEAAWSEIGILDTHRIRSVRYVRGANPVASVLLAESRSGRFAPLMQWSGDMPAPQVHRIGSGGVLVIEKNFGGNIPIVRTWAWVWSPTGPIRLDVAGAIRDGIYKVAPGHTGYDTGLDWGTLHCVTWTWAEGKYPGKVGVDERAEIWLQLENTHLSVKRAIWKNEGDEKHWP